MAEEIVAGSNIQKGKMIPELDQMFHERSYSANSL
jgi:hypothetical protein